ncbi:MAG TPA: TauD/TfdA family dioxygenase [Pyrinomonadaceae bacterium]|jgi:alpha-ketoglutarate-dependent taurine dioxygenase|nr:TauD/TfdA family dioxygenase [Pyrinomonadaceae bacterium]
MQYQKRKEIDRFKFKALKPEAISLSQRELIKTSYLQPDQSLPLVIEPAVGDVDLTDWVKSNREFVVTELRRHGGLLFRNFDIDSVAKFDHFAISFSPKLMDYLDQHTPRTRISENIYTSTEYPADQHVPFHSENSKNHVWPLKLWFFCEQPAAQGGETPIADNRRVFELLDPKIRERFIEKGVMYQRNFGEGVGLSWQTVFQTNRKEQVENFCRHANAQLEWKGGDRLRMQHVCPSVARHPQTGDLLWFNQAHLFHVSNLERSARESMLSMFEEADLPSNSYYGDGSPIETSVLDEVREVFDRVAVKFPWQRGDILMLDNMLVAHGRAPFKGSRKVFVAMAEPWSHQENNQREGLQ